ncbi:hypothetical protein B0T19DRAFT_246057 [Cercophora scortea]|uniref:Secreted protein n=1 Tax=Cercophora scortea TaxID=314031 RepID=A0AAE0I8X4_9PEZI|nr:hypothetical protein B0T19DRAFT_246057 [Cercophora scortea]
MYKCCANPARAVVTINHTLLLLTLLNYTQCAAICRPLRPIPVNQPTKHPTVMPSNLGCLSPEQVALPSRGRHCQYSRPLSLNST